MEKDGGSAFPEVFTDFNEYRKTYDVYSAGGMSLRDYFAGQVLSHLKDIISRDAASFAYKVADDMLRVRLEKDNNEKRSD